MALGAALVGRFGTMTFAAGFVPIACSRAMFHNGRARQRRRPRRAAALRAVGA